MAILKIVTDDGAQELAVLKVPDSALIAVGGSVEDGAAILTNLFEAQMRPVVEQSFVGAAVRVTEQAAKAEFDKDVWAKNEVKIEEPINPGLEED